MNIHWFSNAPWAPTGYGNQTKVFLERLQDLGHDMSMTAFWGLEGAPLNINNIKIYPRMFHPYGQDIVSLNAIREKADIMISLMDAWVCQPETWQPGMKWVPWFPVDSEPLPPPIVRRVEKAHDRIVFSRFAVEMMREAGLDCRYVPHGIETKVFKPMPNPRKYMGWAEDRFIVGMVAANKGNPSRKAFIENLEGFSIFLKKHPGALLYLHTLDEGTMGAPGLIGYENVNIKEYCDFLGLRIGANIKEADKVDVLLPGQYAYMIGGINAEGNPENNFSWSQWKTLKSLLQLLYMTFGNIETLGHRDLPNVAKDCPCFDVREWLEKEGF